MKNNVLYTVTRKDIVEDLQNKGITKLVYPLSSFCVGIDNTFSIEEIHTEGYLLINRVLDCRAIDELEKILDTLPSNIKGIVFDDVGLIELLKDKSLEKIFYYSHFNTNYKSINYFWDYVDEIIVSTDITEKEIDDIIANTNKKISVFAFGLVSSFYSRRHLLSTYAKHYSKEKINPMDLVIDNKKFLAYENEYGTVLYHYPYYNASRLLKKDIKYSFYLPAFLDKNKCLQILDNNFTDIDIDDGFLDTPTIYKVK